MIPDGKFWGPHAPAADLDLSDDDVRNAAVLLLAADSVLGDGVTAEVALTWARNLENALDTDPTWADGRHQGDCTKSPFTCARCLLEDAEAEARERYES